MDICCCSKTDSAYPKLLRKIKSCPDELFYAGDIGVINAQPCVAIIGSRKISANGMQVAYEYGRIAARNGFTVINGLAIGCDTQAILGALSENGKCVAVLPGGLDKIYPKSNLQLAERIVSGGGCLVSEYTEGVIPQKYSYVQRDRIQSGLSCAVIVVEAETTSGTMHTVKYAKQQMRRLAVYYSKLSHMASGNEAIINEGTGVPVDDEDSLLDFLMMAKDTKIESYEQLTLFD